MTDSSFTKKTIRVSLSLAEGEFSPGKNTIAFDGLRVMCEISKPGGKTKNSTNINIYGLAMSRMAALSTLGGKNLQVQKNMVKVETITSSGPATCFLGEITDAWVVAQNPPDVHLRISAIEGYYGSVMPSSQKSYKGTVSVASVMRDLAKQLEVSFEDNGVTTQIANPHLIGSPYQQAEMLADAADIEFGLDDGTLYIAPKNRKRNLTAIPLISPSTGMHGSPVHGKEGLRVVTLYNPAIKIGGVIQVESAFVKTALWRVHGVKHHLESESPSGKWETHISAANIATPGSDPEKDAGE